MMPPVHGQERNKHLETHSWDTGHGFEQTVADRWCEHCRQWICTRGVTGVLRWLAEHQDGDCSK